MFFGFCTAWVGDYLSQTRVEQKEYSYFRGLVVASYSGIEIMVEARVLFPALEVFFGKFMSTVVAMKKAVFEQIFYTPLEAACFIKWTNSIEHQPESFKDKMSRDYVYTLGTSWGYWLPVSFVNYYLVPVKYRPLYIAGSTFIIDIIMSYATHNNLRQSYERIIEKFL